MIKLVVFDLDDVIIDGEAIDEIGKLANLEEEISAITARAMNGEIDYSTSLRERVELLKGTSVEDIQKLATEIGFKKGAVETVKAIKDRGIDVIAISGCFDLISNEIKDELGIENIFVNEFGVEDGKLSGEVFGPIVDNTKINVLNDYIADKDITLEEVVAVGDGANDISMLEAVGCGVGFNSKDVILDIADVIIEEIDLTKVLDVLDDLEKDEAPEEEEAEEVVEEEAAEEEAAEDEEAEEVVEEEAAEEEAAEDEEAEEEAKPEFVLADTIEGVREQKNEKEAEIAQITEEREEFNRIAKEQRKIRDELNSSLKENLNKAIEFRNTRNEVNKAVTEAKKARNEANNKIKNLEWSSGKRDKIKIENEIRKIDKIIETRVLDIKKENQLVKNANDLRKQLHEITEDESVKEEALELKKVSEEEHAKVIELSEQAQEAHEEMLKYFRATDDIRTAADEAHKKFIEARKNASAKHEEFKAVLSDIRIINKKLGSNRPKRSRSKKSSNANKNSEEKERAEAIFEKFKNGGKLSTEELLLLQKYNIG